MRKEHGAHGALACRLIHYRSRKYELNCILPRAIDFVK